MVAKNLEEDDMTNIESLGCKQTHLGLLMYFSFLLYRKLERLYIS